METLASIQTTLSVSIAAGQCGHTTRESYKKSGKWPENIDQSRTRLNVVFEGAGTTSTKAAFNRIFSPMAEKRYDEEMAKPAKQRHVKRLDDVFAYDPWEYFVKSKRYTQKITDGKPVVGLVFQAGNRETGWVYDRENVEAMTEYYREVFEDFKERNPDFLVLTAAVHFDEATPHLHIDGIPMSSDRHCVYGVAAALSPMVKKNMSPEDRKDYNEKVSQKGEKYGVLAWWQNRELDAYDGISKRYGIERVDAGKGGEHLGVREYKAGRELLDREHRAVDREIRQYRDGQMEAADREIEQYKNDRMDEADQDARAEAGKLARRYSREKLAEIDLQVGAAKGTLAGLQQQIGNAQGQLAAIEASIRERQEAVEKERERRRRKQAIEPPPHLEETEPGYLRGELPPVRGGYGL